MYVLYVYMYIFFTTFAKYLICKEKKKTILQNISSISLYIFH